MAQPTLHIVFFLLTFGVSLTGQSPCPQPVAFYDLQVGNIQARINTGGDLFTDYTDDGGFRYLPETNDPSTIFTSGLWLGGKDSVGIPKLATMTYRIGNDKVRYTAGPIVANQVADCSLWDRLFLVNKSQIQEFVEQLPNLVFDPAGASIMHPEVMGWPGANNPYFSAVHSFQLPENHILAPFFDVNADGVYDPLQGDLPAVQLTGGATFIPEKIIWCVYSDVGTTHSFADVIRIGAEIQQTVWAFQTFDYPMSNTIFTSHKVIYKGQKRLTNFGMGLFVDFDLGCHKDDYVGCLPAEHTFFGYNKDDQDGMPGASCGFTGASGSFQNRVPIQSVTFLNRPLTSHFSFNGSTPEPYLPFEFYHHLHPVLNTGEPFPDSLRFVFPDDPAMANGQSMCAQNTSVSDVRSIGASMIGDVSPGAVFDLITAWTLHTGNEGGCSIQGMEADVSVVKNEFANGFMNYSAVLPDVPDWVQVAPNPARDRVRLSVYPSTEGLWSLFSLDGRLVQSGNLKNDLEIDLSGLSAGAYWLRCMPVAGSVFMVKIIKI